MEFTCTGIYRSRRSPVLARNVVATSQPLAVQAGLRMLQRGGNAMDAALAAAMTLVVVEPTGNGLGSDAFCILWDGAELHGLNASGRSPAGWAPDRFKALKSMPARGWDSVTVPGAVSAWVELSRRFGKLPFATLFEPAIQSAEGGYLVSPIIAETWRRGAGQLKDQPGYAQAFMPDGRAPRAGELFRNRPLAGSLRLIAESEGESFYRGELADRIASFSAAHKAALTADDLAAHRNNWCGTLAQRFGDAELHEIPPNGQGLTALIALGILQHVGIEDCKVDSPDALHLQIEAIKLAFADAQAYVSDLDYMRRVTPSDLLSPDYLAARAKMIDARRAQAFGAGAPKRGGTVCLAAADESGMMVSFIQSNYSGFGSGIVVPETGISLQNRGSGFCLEPGHPNEVGGGKRPFHTIIPGFIMRNGRPNMAFGVMGGPIQAQAHVQMFLRTQIWNQDPQTAAEAPRWRFIDDMNVAIEPDAGMETIAALKARGHRLTREAPEENFGFGGAQLVCAVEGGFIAGSDPRKDGQAAGF
jgi:gamma-glutamyltranspeptidase/glutathione hydrolase